CARERERHRRGMTGSLASARDLVLSDGEPERKGVGDLREPERESRRAAARGGAGSGGAGRPVGSGAQPEVSSRPDWRVKAGSPRPGHNSVRARQSICANENVLAFVVPRQNVRWREDKASGAPERTFLRSTS